MAMCRVKCYLSSEGDSSLLGDTTQVMDALLASYASRHTSHHHSKGYIPDDHYHSDFPRRVDLCHGKGGSQRRVDAGPPPVLCLLREACHEQRDSVGCGVTTVVCLAAYWAPEVLSLLQQVARGHALVTLINSAAVIVMTSGGGGSSDSVNNNNNNNNNNPILICEMSLCLSVCLSAGALSKPLELQPPKCAWLKPIGYIA